MSLSRAAAISRPRIFRGWWIVLAGFLGAFVEAGAGGFSFSVLIRPMAEDLGTSATSIVFGLTIASISSAVSSFFVGPAVDRYGARGLMAGGALAAAGLFFLTSRISSTWELYLLFGVGIGCTRPLVSQVVPAAAVANWFRRRRVEAFTFMSMASSVSGALTPLTALIVVVFGWRSAWVMLGLLTGLVVAPLAWVFIRQRPEDVGLRSDGDPAPTADEAKAPPEREWSRAQVLRTSAFWLLLLGQLLINAPASSILIHIVPFVQDYGFDLTLATTLLSIYAMGALAGRPVWAYATKMLAIQGALVLQAFCYAAAIALVVVVAILAPSPYLLYPSMTALGVVAGGGQQLRFQSWADYFGRNVIGTVTGYASVGQTLTTATSPLFLAIVRDATGSYLPGFAVFIVFCLVAGVATMFARIPEQQLEVVTVQ